MGLEYEVMHTKIMLRFTGNVYNKKYRIHIQLACFCDSVCFCEPVAKTIEILLKAEIKTKIQILDENFNLN